MVIVERSLSVVCPVLLMVIRVSPSHKQSQGQRVTLPLLRTLLLYPKQTSPAALPIAIKAERLGQTNTTSLVSGPVVAVAVAESVVWMALEMH